MFPMSMKVDFFFRAFIGSSYKPKSKSIIKHQVIKKDINNYIYTYPASKPFALSMS